MNGLKRIVQLLPLLGLSSALIAELKAGSGPLYFLEYDVCVQAATLSEGESVTVDHCTGGVDQSWVMSSAGQLSPSGNIELCLTLEKGRIEAGTPANMDQYWIKKLTLEVCDKAFAARQQWVSQAPESYNPGPTAAKPKP